jgi:DNA-binding response OmpR family regulator
MPHIITIDDDPIFREMACSQMEKLGHDVILAENGSRGMEMTRREKPDLVMLDVGMPDIDGLTVLDRLKASEQTRRIPVMIVSADASLDTILHAMEHQACDYLVKGYDMNTLKRKIDASLHYAKLQRSKDHNFQYETVLVSRSEDEIVITIRRESNSQEQLSRELSDLIRQGLDRECVKRRCIIDIRHASDVFQDGYGPFLDVLERHFTSTIPPLVAGRHYGRLEDHLSRGQDIRYYLSYCDLLTASNKTA